MLMRCDKSENEITTIKQEPYFFAVKDLQPKLQYQLNTNHRHVGELMGHCSLYSCANI